MVWQLRREPPAANARAIAAAETLSASGEGSNSAKFSADFPQKSRMKPQSPLSGASYKLYYVNYEIGLNPRPSHTPVQAVFSLLPLLPLVGGFRGF